MPDAGAEVMEVVEVGEAVEVEETAGAAARTPLVGLTTSASMPGRITRNGNSIFGNAAMRGVRRAAVIEFAAMARCTTRKSVHQYPNDSTNPSPITRPNHSTPTGFADACPMNAQLRVYAPAAKPLSMATPASRAESPAPPPTSPRPRNTSGAKPKTMKKNRSTPLYTAPGTP